MSQNNNTCPKCNSQFSYKDGSLWVCPECFHEWNPSEAEVSAPVSEVELNQAFVDVNGVVLVDGDSVTVTKDLKVGSDTIKSGTKVKSIRLLTDPVDGHDISCKIDGFGSIYLKCSVVRKLKK